MSSDDASGLHDGCMAISGGKGARRGTIYGVYGLLKNWGAFYAQMNEDSSIENEDPSIESEHSPHEK